ncbi:hypothetical protein [Corallococcus carmarthensis]|uniref:hypothetical protein n=1 Tax=Corallococcus carmarthensis TaxID=2316728 RepID=UPI001FC979F7|nr:hypothetical protein [Corallococcus carmarthensis]
MGNDVRFVVTDSRKQTDVFSGKVSEEGLRGTADSTDSNNPKTRVMHAFTARLLPARPAGPPRVHDFKPTTWSNEFSAHRMPVLTVWPGTPCSRRRSTPVAWRLAWSPPRT